MNLIQNFIIGLFGPKHQVIVNVSSGVLGAIITFAVGGWSELLGFFLLAMVLDYATGIVADIKDGNGLSSKVGFVGLLKKGVMLGIVTLAYHMDKTMGTTVIRDGAIYFYLANELISITENCGQLGVPMPDKVKSIIEVLKDKGGGDPNASQDGK